MPAADERVLYFIRHGITAGNVRREFFGQRDYPLLPEEVSRLESLVSENEMPVISALYVSPMMRCRKTAEIFFPGMEQRIVRGFREMDFGEWEGKTNEDLTGDPRYQAFIDSGGMTQFPGGESKATFQQRVMEDFRRILPELHEEAAQGAAAFVVHGGTIMGILDAFTGPEIPYFHWLTNNTEGFRCVIHFEMDGAAKISGITHWEIGMP